MKTKMKVYLVLKMGIYMQGIVGIYNTYEYAIDAAIKAKEMETDNYHSFVIYTQELNNYVLYSCKDEIIVSKGRQ